MLRSLLKQRFQLKIREETKNAPVYVINVARAGPKLQHSRHECMSIDSEKPAIPIDPAKPLPAVCGLSRLSAAGWEAFDVSMDQFAAILTGSADRLVINRTNLSGTYDIRLDIAPADIAGPNAQDQATVFALMRSAVQKQGLRIDVSRGPVKSLFIAAAERPSEN